MLPYSHLRGLPAFTRDQGRRIGQLDEVLIDVGRRTIRWLSLRGRGWFGARQWVPTRAVHGVGPDALILTDDHDLTDAPDWSQEAALIDARQELLGKPVITESGRRLGAVRDYEFSPEYMTLTSLSIGNGFSLTGELETIPLTRVVTIGRDAVIVTEAVSDPTPAHGGDNGVDQ